MNMINWVGQQINAQKKKPMPILSFPSVQLLNVSVRELIADSKLQAEGMRLIAGRVNSAAAVSMMDLSVEAEAFGSQIKTYDDEVPTVVGSIVNSYDDAEKLAIPKVAGNRTQLYVDAVRAAVGLITDRPVFAGVIGPFSLSGRLMDVSEIMVSCYEEPETVELVMDKTTQFIIDYINEYKKTGANGVIVAEPLAGLLSPALMEEFAAPYMKKIVAMVQDESFIVTYHNCGNNTPKQIPSILSCGAKAYHFGNAVDMKHMLENIPGDVVVMGNIDPSAEFRNGTPDSMREAVKTLLTRCGAHKNFVISSGCDIPPMSKWENIDTFFQACK